MLFSGAWGKIHEKNLKKLKILQRCPFNFSLIVESLVKVNIFRKRCENFRKILYILALQAMLVHKKYGLSRKF
jgi:hypothetical protein